MYISLKDKSIIRPKHWPPGALPAQRSKSLWPSLQFLSCPTSKLPILRLSKMFTTGQTHWGPVADNLAHTCLPQTINPPVWIQSASKLRRLWWTRKGPTQFVSLNIILSFPLKSKSDHFMSIPTVCFSWFWISLIFSDTGPCLIATHCTWKLYRRSEAPLERIFLCSDRQVGRG